MDIFQRTFESVQEAEGKTGFSGLSQVSAALQEDGCCKFIDLNVRASFQPINMKRH